MPMLALIAALALDQAQPPPADASSRVVVQGAALRATAQAALEQALAAPGRRVALEPLGRDADRAFAGRELALAAQPIGGRLPRARVAVPVEVVVDGRVVARDSVWFAVRVHAPALRWTADRARGATAAPDATAVAIVDLARETDAVVDVAALVGQRLARAVRRDAPVVAADLEPLPAVVRGERVRVAIARGAVRLDAWGTARADAALGAALEIIVDGAQNACRARVIAPGEVEVVP